MATTDSTQLPERPEQFIGARVRYWRQKRGMTQRVLGDHCGVTQGYVSQIESGTQEVDRRSTLVRLAEALQISVAELMDLPGPEFPEHTAADAAVPVLRAALNTIRFREPDTETSRTLDELETAVRSLSDHRKDARYDRLAELLPQILLDLHSIDVAADDEATRAESLRLMVLATYCATFTLKYLRQADLSAMAAEQCHVAASELADPLWLGLADFTRIHSLPPENKAIANRLALEAANRLSPHLGVPDAMQVYGMLHLSAAFTSAICERSDEAWSHLEEASQIADSTGEGRFAEMCFGPTNVAFWQAAVAVELGDGGRVREISRSIRPERVDSKSRQASFHMDVARGLAQARRNDSEAVAHFVRAERIAPQRVRLNPLVLDSVGAMLRRASAHAGGSELRRLAKRVGVV